MGRHDLFLQWTPPDSAPPEWHQIEELAVSGDFAREQIELTFDVFACETEVLARPCERGAGKTSFSLPPTRPPTRPHHLATRAVTRERRGRQINQ